MSTMSSYVCEQCRADIDPEASVCPHCGYDPAGDIESEATKRLIVGLVLTLTLVGAVIGIPLMYSAVRHNRRAEDARPAIEIAAAD